MYKQIIGVISLAILSFSIRGHAEARMKQTLLVIDVQNEYFTGKMPVSYPPKSLDNILKAMDAAISKNIPIIVIQHSAT